MSLFLSPDDLADLTGIKTGRDGKTRGQLQAHQLKLMGIPHWINARGAPIVAVSAIEGRPQQAQDEQPWTPKPLRKAA